MPDDKTKRGGADRKRVAAGQPHEVRYVATQTKKPAKVVKQAIKKAGPSRKKVMRELGK